MSKHTPGPWYPQPTDYGWDVWGNLCLDPHTWVGPIKRTISPHSKTHSQADICADYDETEANAFLICAAPDLAAALRRLVNCPALATDFLEPEDRAALAEADAALSKAFSSEQGK